MDKLQSFKNELFEVSAKVDGAQILFDVEQVSKSLGFTQTKAGREYIRWETVNRYLERYVSQQVGKGDLIPEPLVYKLAFKASNDVAEKFQDWLAIEVIPSIRKHGAYMTPETIEKALLDPDTVIQLATQLKEERQKRLEAQQKVQLQQPIVDYYHRILNSTDTVTTTQIAQDYGMSAYRLNKILHDEGVQYKVNEQWILYGKYKDKGFIRSRTMDVTHSDGRQTVKMYTHWTQKGRVFIHRILEKREIHPQIDLLKEA